MRNQETGAGPPPKSCTAVSCRPVCRTPTSCICHIINHLVKNRLFLGRRSKHAAFVPSRLGFHPLCHAKGDPGCRSLRTQHSHSLPSCAQSRDMFPCTVKLFFGRPPECRTLQKDLPTCEWGCKQWTANCKQRLKIYVHLSNASRELLKLCCCAFNPQIRAVIVQQPNQTNLQQHVLILECNLYSYKHKRS